MTKQTICVPDIGDFHDIPVIEILVKVGDEIVKEQPLLSLESDKATMEVPSEVVGKVVSIDIKVGDKVSLGTPFMTVDLSEQGAQEKVSKPAPKQETISAPSVTQSALATATVVSAKSASESFTG